MKFNFQVIVSLTVPHKRANSSDNHSQTRLGIQTEPQGVASRRKGQVYRSLPTIITHHNDVRSANWLKEITEILECLEKSFTP